MNEEQLFSEIKVMAPEYLGKKNTPELQNGLKNNLKAILDHVFSGDYIIDTDTNEDNGVINFNIRHNITPNPYLSIGQPVNRNSNHYAIPLNQSEINYEYFPAISVDWNRWNMSVFDSEEEQWERVYGED